MKVKPNYKILIVSWALAIAFLIIGIVTLGGATKLSLEEPDYNYDVEAYEEYKYKYKTEDYEYGTFYLYVSGGRLEDVESKNDTSSCSYIGSDYDGTSVYSVFLGSGETTTFIIESTTDNYLKVKLSTSYNLF